MAQTGILSIFARSPIKPLEQHMQKAHDCAQLLLPFYDAVLAKDWEKVSEIRQQICDIENEADLLKMDFRLHMPKNIFLPVPRVDLLELLSKQDKIANITKDISGIIVGRCMSIPKALTQPLKYYLAQSLQAVTQASKAINELDEILESGFSDKEIEHVEKLITALNQIEHETDKLQIDVRQQLFDIESQLNPVDVIFLYKIIDWIGLLADLAQKVGARLRMLTAI